LKINSTSKVVMILVPFMIVLLMSGFSLLPLLTSQQAFGHFPTGKMTASANVRIIKSNDPDCINGCLVNIVFELHCDGSDSKLRFEPEGKAGGSQVKFIMTSLTSVDCSEEPGNTNKPGLPFDTIRGKGEGTCGGVSGAHVAFKFQDSQGNKDDRAGFRITGTTACNFIVYPSGWVAFHPPVKINSGAFDSFIK